MIFYSKVLFVLERDMTRIGRLELYYSVVRISYIYLINRKNEKPSLWQPVKQGVSRDGRLCIHTVHVNQTIQPLSEEEQSLYSHRFYYPKTACYTT